MLTSDLQAHCETSGTKAAQHHRASSIAAQSCCWALAPVRWRCVPEEGQESSSVWMRGVSFACRRCQGVSALHGAYDLSLASRSSSTMASKGVLKRHKSPHCSIVFHIICASEGDESSPEAALNPESGTENPEPETLKPEP